MKTLSILPTFSGEIGGPGLVNSVVGLDRLQQSLVSKTRILVKPEFLALAHTSQLKNKQIINKQSWGIRSKYGKFQKHHHHPECMSTASVSDKAFVHNNRVNSISKIYQCPESAKTWQHFFKDHSSLIFVDPCQFLLSTVDLFCAFFFSMRCRAHLIRSSLRFREIKLNDQSILGSSFQSHTITSHVMANASFMQISNIMAI